MISRSCASAAWHYVAISKLMAVNLLTLDRECCCNFHISPDVKMIQLHRYIASLLFGAGAGGAATIYLFRSEIAGPQLAVITSTLQP